MKRKMILVFLVLVSVSIFGTSNGEAKAIQKIYPPQTKVQLRAGQTIRPNWRIIPSSASTDHALLLSSGDESVCRIDEDGQSITAVGRGSCRITARATDGSEKKASFTVVVPSLAPDVSEVTFSSPEPVFVRVLCLGEDPESNVFVQTKGKTVACETAWQGQTLIVKLQPLLAGKFGLTVKDRKDKYATVSIPVTVELSAVPVQSHIGITKASFEALHNRVTIRNQTGLEINEIGFVYRYFDRFGNQNFRSSSVADIDDEVQAVTWSVLDHSIKPGEKRILGLEHTEMTHYFNTVRTEVAIRYYCDTNGKRVYIPENELNWYSSEEEDYVGTFHATPPCPDLTESEKQAIRKTDLGFTSVSLFYDYAVHMYYTRSGCLVDYVKADSPASLAGIREGDLIYAVDGIAWADDPLVLSRAHARFAAGTPIALEIEHENHTIENIVLNP